MADLRFFSDSIKLEVIKNNLKKYDGDIRCEMCNIKLNSIEECHFDHIYPYAKGGKSSLSNCQILCSQCNLRKNDKELEDFVLEDKAKQFLAGQTIPKNQIEDNKNNKESININPVYKKFIDLSKEEFDEIIRSFIEKKGDIHKVDFSRAYNGLPSIWYVREYYGDLNTLKKAFGIEDLSLNWTRDKIIEVLRDYVSVHGDVTEKDLKKKNGLPSYPCIIKYFPEYTFASLKQELLGIKNVYKVWTRDEIIKAGKDFVKENGRITEKDLKAKNGLPTSKVIYNHFGNINNFQQEVGAPITSTLEYVTRETIEKAVNEYFGDNERVVESRKVFFENFPYGISTIYKRYDSFEEFCAVTGINFLSTKKGAYSKKEIDDAIHNWIFSGNDIPKSKELTKNGLPSIASIMKYYESWREPFFIYKKIYDEANRNILNTYDNYTRD